MAELSKLIHIELDDSGLPAPTAEVERERKVALFDLMEENVFGLIPRADKPLPDGPYQLFLSIKDRRVVCDVRTEDGSPASEFHLSVSPLKQVIKDYFQICESYFEAVKKLPPAQIEAIDMGRRGIHDEGSRQLMDRLEGKILTDMPTARRLFTLICVLHMRG
ncbi:UPF0262 family protein [Roseobacter sp. N2S]|uniref:UPF0262 family protein n=1 Tax=Roseobacter sp. N2S TaxID=2663844 RepID=UPI00285D6B88|nr:uncharacterized protein (UPF0262 family) [Roseobacter sp. N2S]